MGLVLGIDVSTTATKAILVDEAGRRRSASASSEYPFERRARSGASRTRSSGGTARPRRSGPCWPRPASRGTTSQRSASPARCTASCSSTRRTRSSGRRSCGTTSGPRPSATLIRAALGPGAPRRDHRQRRAHRVHRAEARLGPRPRAGRLGRGSPTSSCPRTTCAAGSPASTPWTRPTAPGRSCSTSPPATGRRRSWTRSRIDPAWMPPTYEGPEVTGHASRRRRRPPRVCGPGTPVVAGGGDQAANAVGVGAVVPGVVALSLGTSGVVFATTDRPLFEARGPGARLLPRRAGPVAHDVGDAVGGRQPALVPRRPRARRRRSTTCVAAGRRGARRAATGLLFLPYLTGERCRTPIRSRAAPSSA